LNFESGTLVLNLSCVAKYQVQSIKYSR
jgi:hypothetical protein